jgi:hypothetical protein
VTASGAGATWREQRREASAVHADALERRRATEAGRARALIADFLVDVRARQVAPVPLHARSYDGRHRYRTPLLGWYLRRDKNVAIGTDGNYYVLGVPTSLRAQLRGTSVEPRDPPLVVGAGGKDGESLDLEVAIARVLAGGVGQ